MVALTLSSGLAGFASLTAVPSAASATAGSTGWPLWAYGVCGSLLGAGGGCLAGLRAGRRAWKRSSIAAAKAIASTDDPLPPTLLTSCGSALASNAPFLQQRLKSHAQPGSPVPLGEGAPPVSKGLTELAFEHQLDERAFVGLLRRLVAQSWHLQNDPKRDLIPDERRAATVVQDELLCFSERYGGPLDIQELVADPNQPARTNLKVVYTPPDAPEAEFATVTFVTHFDVLPPRVQATRERSNSISTSSFFWVAHGQGQQDPFRLTRFGGKLYGCGTSSGLGDAALLTQLFCALGRHRPRLRCRVVGLYLAASQGGEAALGADWLLAGDKLQESYLGPLCWLGVPGSRLCCSTTGVLGWSLGVIAQRGANSIELASKALSHLQAGFARLFPKLPADEEFGYAAGSTMKPTHVRCHSSPLSEAVVDGEIHVTPAYRVTEVASAVEALVEEFCKDALVHEVNWVGEEASPSGGFHGKVELSWSDRPDNQTRLGMGRRSRSGECLAGQTPGRSAARVSYVGLAEDLEGLHVNCSSQGHLVLAEALGEVFGEESARPCSVQGSVPHARRFKEAGLDVQLFGFGVQDWHLQEAEFCLLQDMRRGFRVLLRVVESYGQPKEDLESEFSRQPSDESTFSPDSWANNAAEEGLGIGSQTAFDWCSSLLPQRYPLSPQRGPLNSSSPSLTEDCRRGAEPRLGRARSWSTPTSGKQVMERTPSEQVGRQPSLSQRKMAARERGRASSLQRRSPSLSPPRRLAAEADGAAGGEQEKQEPQELLSPLRPRRLAGPRRQVSSPPTRSGFSSIDLDMNSTSSPHAPAASGSHGDRRVSSPSPSRTVAGSQTESEAEHGVRQRCKHLIWQPPAGECTESYDAGDAGGGDLAPVPVAHEGEEKEEVGWLAYLGATFSPW